MDAQSLALTAFEQAPIGLVMTRERVIVACNETFAGMTLYNKNELIGHSFEKLYANKAEFEAVRDVGLASLQSGQSYSDLRLLNRKDGTLIWCRFRAQTLNTEKPLSEAILSYAQIADPHARRPLSNREQDVVKGLTRGQTSKQMAEELGLSVRTIEDVRYRLLKKFDARTTNQLLSRFMNVEI